MALLTINHNLIAINTLRNLGDIYDSLNKSVQRLSSGLRINSAADDAAGMAIRSKMRTDIRVMAQGIRNAADGISLIQTAEGAMSVIDEKLIRMKELAEQAATGTYTTAQRSIINSEYQAMAAEIDRIANATTFNGIHLLNGMTGSQHQGSGLKIHFGLGNNPAEDYYFLRIPDMQATKQTGLRVGTSDERSTIQTTALSAASPTSPLAKNSAADGFFGIRYSENFDAQNPANATWNLYGYVAMDASRTSINDMVQEINRGAQAQGSISINNPASLTGSTLNSLYLTINGQVFGFSSVAGQGTYSGSTGTIHVDDAARADAVALSAKIASYLNDHAASIGVYGAHNGSTVQLIANRFGEQGNLIDTSSNLQSIMQSNQTKLKDGGRQVMTASAYYDEKNSQWQLRIQMNQGGEKYQLQTFGFASLGQMAGSATIMGGPITNVGFSGQDRWMSQLYTNRNDYGDNYRLSTYQGLRAGNQWLRPAGGNGNSDWDGANILTQSAAQQALAALDAAITQKDTARANLGASQRCLESSISLMQIQMGNLQAAESRISDADIALEMMMFARNQIKLQVATAMLAQANHIPELLLKLITNR